MRDQKISGAFGHTHATGRRPDRRRGSRRLLSGALLATAAMLPAALTANLSAAAEPAPFSEADTARIQAALRAAKTGNLAAALAARGKIGDPAGRRLVTWFAQAQGRTPERFADIAAFRSRNADWPVLDENEFAAERAITAKTDAASVEAWFALQPPRTWEGLNAAYLALWRDGRKDAARRLVRRTWRQVYHAHGVERQIHARFKGLLTATDEYARVSDLLRRGKTRQAQALAKLVGLGKGEQAAVTARLRMISKRTRGNEKLVLAAIAEVPEALRREENFHFALAQWNQRAKREKELTRLLIEAPRTPAHPERWWKVREDAIRGAFADGDYERAWALARSHRQRGSEKEAFAQFMAGFVALRLVNQPEPAAKHFARGLEVSQSPWDISQNAYWRGRAAAALGDEPTARHYWERAAHYGHTIYGQLAAKRLGWSRIRLAEAEPLPQDSPFWKDGLVRSAHLLLALGERSMAYKLALRVMEKRAETPGQQQYMVRWMTRTFGTPERLAKTRVRVTKYAQYQGVPLVFAGYPTIDLPATNIAEPALVYSLIRQESEFDPRAKSWVGARGLMQLMHFTARHEAREEKMRYSLARLTSDPAYNLRLGTAHVKRLLDYFDGAYPLILAGYNAGAGRANRWLKQNGDPRRDPNRDWIDWIEMIPFTETRLYTKRVLEAVPIYRLKLKDRMDARELTAYWSAPKRDPQTVCAVLAAKAEPVQIEETADYSRLTAAMAMPDLPETSEPGEAKKAERVLPTLPEIVRGGREKQAKRARMNPSGIDLVARRPHDNIPGNPDCSPAGE